MISLDEFYSAYGNFRSLPNDEQRDAVSQKPETPLFIVAGPGTGKTTCLSLRILKLIFVDDIPPHGILATTFTKKAAGELRSRILSWGFQLVEALQKDKKISKDKREAIAATDINQVVTGTIDSICEQVLRDHRDPGTQPPILADEFVSRTLLLREGLLDSERYKDNDLDAFLFKYSGKSSSFGWNLGSKTDLLQIVWDRRYHDQIRWKDFVKKGAKEDKTARLILDTALMTYRKALDERLMVDFVLLEQELLDRLRKNKLSEFLEGLQVVLVDEYQDTNPLQEQIYFELAKACGGALTVVGDDDQSLYRFRGATVELFSGFVERYKDAFGNAGKKPRTVFLKTNYRSPQSLIQFVNDYARLDDAYQAVRVKAKPKLIWGPGAGKGIPVLGMFRDNVKTLARDLARFIYKVFRGKGYSLPGGETISCDPEKGDMGDCALLCSSPQDYGSGGKERLPLLLKGELSEKKIEVFNPRGQHLGDIPLVRVFGGLILECLDSGGVIQNKTKGLSEEVIKTFDEWRSEAVEFVDKSAPKGLLQYATGWADRDPKRKGWEWPKSVPVLELIYGLVHFFPKLHDDPEGQIYLEVFTRQVSACEQVGKFSARVVTDPSNPGLSEASIRELLLNFLEPVASGAIKVNEEIIDTFPRDRLNILSIHQAKGLEFPLTIVDVGSDFKSNHWTQAFKRFPRDGGAPHAMEDLLRPFSDLSTARRTARDRAFDDLYRQFFVAYSRAQNVLLLVGLETTFPGGKVPNVATGWKRSQDCPWKANIPFTRI